MLKRLKSFKYAFTGITDFFSSEPNVKIHLLAGIFAIAAGFFFSISPTEWCLVIISIAMVLSAEGLNTAIEHLTDLVSPNYHELARKTKDIAAGAVLITAIGAAIVGIIIFLPKIILFLEK